MTIDGGLVSASAVKKLGSLRKLSHLILEGSDIGDQYFADLAGLDCLSEIYFRNCSFSNDCLKPLAEIPRVGMLRFEGCKNAGKCLEPLKLLSTPFSVSNCSFNDGDWKFLFGSSNELTVDVDLSSVTESSLLALRQANPGWSVTWGSIKGYANTTHFPSVRKLLEENELLTFRGSHITDASMAVLKDAPNVTSIWLDKCAVSDLGLRHLQSLKHLKQLIVSEANITDEGLRSLQGLELDGLNLDKTKVRGEGLAYLSTKIKQLHLSPVISNDFVLCARFRELEFLSLGGPLITDEAIDELAKLTSLRFLKLMDTAVSEAGRARLSQALPNCGIQL